MISGIVHQVRYVNTPYRSGMYYPDCVMLNQVVLGIGPQLNRLRI